MKFTVLSPEEFTNFANNHPDKSFFQTTQIATIRALNDWEPHYVGVKEGDAILAATMMVGKSTFFGFKTFYAPGGPLIDYENTKLLNFFITHLKSYLKSQKAYVFHIDPYYELIERDRNGQVVENGFNHQKAANNLKKLGFKSLKISEQPKYLFALDLEKRTPDELLASFKRNTRNHIRKTEKEGVTVRELNRSELPTFKKITASTSERRNFTDKPLSYYESMFDLFGDQVKFLLAETTIDGKTVPLSAAMFMLYGDEIIYLFSGSYKKYMNYNAQYAIQWNIIKYAAEHNFKRYNFYGIQGLPDPKKPDYGVYEFKKGFGGRVIELLGSHELPISGTYYLHSILAFLKHLC